MASSDQGAALTAVAYLVLAESIAGNLCTHGRRRIWSSKLLDDPRTNSDKGQVAVAKARAAREGGMEVESSDVEGCLGAVGRVEQVSQDLVVPLAELVREVGMVAGVRMGWKEAVLGANMGEVAISDQVGALTGVA